MNTTTSKWTIILYDRWTAREIGPALSVFSPEAEFDFGLIDHLSFEVEVDSPIMEGIWGNSLGVVAKLWRTVGGWSSIDPDFAGVVGPIESSSIRSNKVKLTAFSPMWILQSRFLYADAPGVAAPFVDADPSTIMQAFLDYTNARGDTHIIAGSMPPTVPIAGEKLYGQKQQIYAGIMEFTGLLGGIDLTPRYVHDDGSTTLMRLDSSPLGGCRGAFQRNARVEFGLGAANCDDCGVSQVPTIGETANFIHGEGDGGVPEYGNYAASIATIGLLERNEEYQGVQTFDLVKALVDDSLVSNSLVPVVLAPTLSPAKAPWYLRDFNLGDVLPTGARKGDLTIRANLRAYNAKLALSDGGAESTTLQLAPDFSESVEIPPGDVAEPQFVRGAV